MLNNDEIFKLKQSDEIVFHSFALELFRWQAKNVDVYRRFIENLGIIPKNIDTLQDIPFLPVEFFKTDKVYCAEKQPEIVFTSSSTTNTGESKHFISDLSFYEKSFTESFTFFYGKPENYCFLFLLPHYLERQGSSLIYMADNLIKKSKYKQSGFYLNNFANLYKQLVDNEKQSIPTILFGVSFGLLVFSEHYSMKLQKTIIIETGGMKGRRQEISRQELHSILCNRLGVEKIHSEYGMTELLIQAYSKGNGIVQTPPWMKILIYDLYNPLKTRGITTGGINIIDLANKFSCAFIQTDDIGTIMPDSTFKVIGRKDNSEIRGCNLLLNS